MYGNSTGRITTCELGIEVPSERLFASAEIAKRAMDDAVSNPALLSKKVDTDVSDHAYQNRTGPLRDTSMLVSFCMSREDIIHLPRPVDECYDGPNNPHHDAMVFLGTIINLLDDLTVRTAFFDVLCCSAALDDFPKNNRVGESDDEEKKPRDRSPYVM